MTLELKPFQQEGSNLLTQNKRFLLLDEMGLGKTPQFIKAADALKIKRILVTCKAIAKEKWAREINNWGSVPRSIHIVTGTKDKIPDQADVVLINYDVMQHYRFEKGQFELLGLDEAQSLNNYTAKRTAGIYGEDGLARIVPWKWVLSGGLARNHPGELWVHLHTLFGTHMAKEGVAFSYMNFQKQFCSVDAMGKIRPSNTKNLEPLRKFLKGRFIRRYVKDVTDQIPPRFETVPLRPKHTLAELADAFDFQLPEFPEDATDDEILDSFGSLEYASFKRLCGIALIDPVAELVKSDFEEGMHKVVLFCFHRQVIEGLEDRLRKYGVVVIHGGKTPKQKEQALQAYNNGPAEIAICQIQSCGTSIDMPVGNEVIFVEQHEVPADNAQAFKRVDRPLAGQTRSVRARFPYIVGSVHERIIEALKRKTEVLDKLDQ